MRRRRGLPGMQSIHCISFGYLPDRARGSVPLPRIPPLGYPWRIAHTHLWRAALRQQR